MDNKIFTFTISRNSEVSKSKHISILSSIYSGLQFLCLYLVSLFDFSAMKLRYANYKEIPAFSTCHLSRERAVLDQFTLRKHDTAIISDVCREVPSLTYML